MQKLLSTILIVCLAAAPLLADEKEKDEKETDRVKAAGDVLKEILDIPDDIPQDLLDRAECVIVLPSVLKFAIGIGGSYGRGVMTCRSGAKFTGRFDGEQIQGELVLVGDPSKRPLTFTHDDG